ncbi:MAG: rhodanese-like domain-containing protein [Actinomycetota bacterium]|nr:rhodanese-like domain-containing protein [Actinomycetota bacterium]
MEEGKSFKFKKTRLTAILITVLAGLGVILIALSLLFGFGIPGKKEASLSLEGNEESAAEITSSEQTDTKDVALIESEDGTSNTIEENGEATLISVEEVYEIIASGEDYFILDVRNQDEYDEAHIGGAVLIPVSALESRLDDLPRDRPIITYCKSGGRSATAASILVENGFTEVYDMGGITEWIDKGYPTVSEE